MSKKIILALMLLTVVAGCKKTNDNTSSSAISSISDSSEDGVKSSKSTSSSDSSTSTSTSTSTGSNSSSSTKSSSSSTKGDEEEELLEAQGKASEKISEMNTALGNDVDYYTFEDYTLITDAIDSAWFEIYEVNTVAAIDQIVADLEDYIASIPKSPVKIVKVSAATVNENDQIVITFNSGITVVTSLTVTSPFSVFSGPTDDAGKAKFIITSTTLDLNAIAFEITFTAQVALVGENSFTLVFNKGALSSLSAIKADCLDTISNYLANGGYTQAIYGAANWTIMTDAVTKALEDIENATTIAEMNDIRVAFCKLVDEMPQGSEYLAQYIDAGKAELTEYVNGLVESDYLPANWIIVQEKLAIGLAAIEQCQSTAMITKAIATAIADINTVELYRVKLIISKFNIHGIWFLEFYFSNTEVSTTSTAWKATIVCEGQTYVSTTIHNRGTDMINISFAGVFTGDGKTYTLAIETQQNGKIYSWNGVFQGNVQSSIDAYRNIAISNLNAYLVTKEYIEVKYTSADWAIFQQHLTEGKAAINAATTVAGVDAALASTKTKLDAVQQTITLDVQKETAKYNLLAIYGAYIQTDYTTENWDILKGHYDDGVTAINSATTKAEIDSAYDAAVNNMKGVARIPLYEQRLLFAAGEQWNPHNTFYIQMGLKMPDGSNISGVTNASATLTHDGTKYTGACDFARIAGQVFITFSSFGSDTAKTSYTVLLTFTKNSVKYGIEFKVVNGARPTIL